MLIGYVSYWFSGTFAWLFDELIGERVLTRQSTEAVWVSRVLLFALLLFGVAGPLQNIVFSKSLGSGGSMWRRVKGLLLDLTVVGVVWVLPVWAIMETEWDPEFSAHWILPWILAFGAFFLFKDRMYGRLGKMTAPVRQWWRRRVFGAGGSAGFGGMLEEFAARFRSGGILLGSSLYYSPRRGGMFKIGVQDDRHMLTIASNRSGKGRSAIIPNLIVWPYSALVIDPKGTNAAVTAARRGQGGGRVTDFLGQDVFVVDPFDIVDGVRRCAFNPLADIDVSAITLMEDIGLLSDALVVEETGTNKWFSDGAKTIISGVVAHLVVEQEKTPTLLDVRRALLGSADELDAMFGAMMEREATGVGLLTRAAASLLDQAGPNARGGLFNTVTGNLRWLDSAAMGPVLGHSDFDIGSLKNGRTTVYVVLPPYLLDEHKRFMRMFINLAIRELAKLPKSKTPVLFVLDEFFSLGPLTCLEKASGLLASDKVKLWPILQNLTQLIELYPKNWETFFSNAGAAQVFAVNDLRTEEHLMKMLGKTVRDIEVGGRLQRVVAQLRETEEMEEELAREGGREIVFRSGAPPLLLRRTDYDRSFPKSQYAPDPDHPGS